MKKIFCVLILLSCSFAFSKTRAINSFCLDFENQTVATGNILQITRGSFYYSSIPFIFVFKTTEPVQTFYFLTEDGCYNYDIQNEFSEEFSEAKTFLTQTMKDILNWFNEDLGLSKTGYEVVSVTNVDDSNIAVWKYKERSEQIIKEVHTFSNCRNQFTKIQMFLSEEDMMSETNLLNYVNENNFVFPSCIETKTYSDNELVMSVFLKFSNFSLNNKINVPKECIAVNSFEKSISKERNINKESSFNKNSSYDLINSDSIFGITAFGAYSFYKKFITNQDTTNCPFYPSCSTYVMQAIQKNGLLGILQGFERLKRCTSTEHKRNIYPLTEDKKQYDPVP